MHQDLKGGSIVSARWVFTWKSDKTGKVVKAKARVVAINRLFRKRSGVDCNGRCAPNPAASCIRLMAASCMLVAIRPMPI